MFWPKGLSQTVCGLLQITEKGFVYIYIFMMWFFNCYGDDDDYYYYGDNDDDDGDDDDDGNRSVPK